MTVNHLDITSDELEKLNLLKTATRDEFAQCDGGTDLVGTEYGAMRESFMELIDFYIV